MTYLNKRYDKQQACLKKFRQACDIEMAKQSFAVQIRSRASNYMMRFTVAPI